VPGHGKNIHATPAVPGPSDALPCFVKPFLSTDVGGRMSCMRLRLQVSLGLAIRLTISSTDIVKGLRQFGAKEGFEAPGEAVQ
jgi:hypothetical protein